MGMQTKMADILSDKLIKINGFSGILLYSENIPIKIPCAQVQYPTVSGTLSYFPANGQWCHSPQRTAHAGALKPDVHVVRKMFTGHRDIGS